MRVASALALTFALFSGAAFAQDDNATKIVGKWELSKSGSGIPPGATAEFTKDGKVTVTMTVGGKTDSMSGTYKIEKDKLTFKMKVGGKEDVDTATIKKLTDEVMELEDKEKKVDEFKKVKAKKEK